MASVPPEQDGIEAIVFALDDRTSFLRHLTTSPPRGLVAVR
jgi:hypothetical protein